MSVQLIRPIDICDRCDGLFPLEPITPTIKVLKFKKVRRGSTGPIFRLHHECVEVWKKSLDIL